MPPAAGLSRYLANGLVPLCIWGMLSALILHLLEVRSLFIQGGEDRLRMAVLAFSLGVILSQRLAAQQGRETANGYRWGLGAAMALFTLYHAFAYRLPVHPLPVALVNGLIFAALWWVGTRITAACSVDSEEAAAAAAETGILARSSRLRREFDSTRVRSGRGLPRSPSRPAEKALSAADAEKLWKDRLSSQHPGRVIFLFSLVAIPAFGLGMFLFGGDRSAGVALGIHLFLYLWCALTLLFLSSLNQLTAYFDQRQVTLPEIVGMTWLALGFAVVCIIVPLAFLLPQPASPAGDFVRERLVASYRGWESKTGLQENLTGTDPKGRSGDGAGETGARTVQSREGHSVAEQQAAKQLGEEAGLDKAYIVKDSGEGRVKAAKDGVHKIFDLFLKTMLLLGVVAGAVVVVVMLVVVWTGLRARLASLRPLVRRRERKQRKRDEKRRLRDSPAAFSTFRNPFGPGADFDDEDLVRHLWKATLAWCEDAGFRCEPDQTPFEFLATSPAPLRGLEAPSRRLVSWLMHVEFSKQPLPARAFDELRDYWTRLQEHAEKV